MPVFHSAPGFDMHYEVEESGLASVEQNRAWQQKIPNSKLLVLPGNSYHVAVSDAELCARATLDFIAQAGHSRV